MKPRLYVDQKITAFINRYQVFSTDDSGEKDQPVAFVEQKRGKIKEKVNFFSDENKQEVLFSFRAEKVMDVHGKYFVEDAEGKLIGYFQKDFKSSFIKSTWHVFNEDDKQLLTVTESNPVLAVLRRYVGLVPVVGELIDIVVMFFKYHFVILESNTQNVVGKFEKLSIFKDKYKLSLDDKTYKHIDERLAIAMAVALDALQSR